jgi:hypothetical protein
MEACLSAHFVSRTARALGHSPRIIPAIYLKPCGKGQKNDYNDAEAIAEAAMRPNLRTVRQKAQAEVDLQAYPRRCCVDRRHAGLLPTVVDWLMKKPLFDGGPGGAQNHIRPGGPTALD